MGCAAADYCHAKSHLAFLTDLVGQIRAKCPDCGAVLGYSVPEQSLNFFRLLALSLYRATDFGILGFPRSPYGLYGNLYSRFFSAA